MNLILLLPGDFIDADHVRLDGRRAAHIREVHRVAVGSALRVGLINDRIGSGIITVVTDTHVELEVCLTEAPPRAIPLTLLLALPRPKVVKRVLQSIAALGVKRIVLVNSWRVDKSYWSSPLLTPEAIRGQLVLGLEQACDTVMPEVSVRRLFKPFVEDEVATFAQGRIALVAHPAAAAPCPRSLEQPVVLAVGPEGGFIQYEIELLGSHGFQAVSLGPRRLRVEHAITAAVARLF